jgi:hypothetical protein
MRVAAGFDDDEGIDKFRERVRLMPDEEVTLYAQSTDSYAAQCWPLANRQCKSGLSS